MTGMRLAVRIAVWGAALVLLGGGVIMAAMDPRPGEDRTATVIDVIPFASGFSAVSDITHAGDERLFVAEVSGLVHLVSPEGAVHDTPFLDVRDRVLSGTGEYGLAGLAFPPDYDASGAFYVSYTNLDGDAVVSRFYVSAYPDVADPSSEEILLTVPQPSSLHNSGDLVFGPDGYLYVALGDGGPLDDPNDNGQNGQTLLGTILRLDVNGATPYEIPDDNPFVGDPDVRDEIWAYGLRNPWRFSFDPLTGDAYITDVGEHDYEEINFKDTFAPAGQNYGWRCYEGNGVFNFDGCEPDGDYTFPVFGYGHSSGCAIIGGYVYRGTQVPLLAGHYLFADHCNGDIRSIVLDPDAPGGWRSAASGNYPGDWNTFGKDVSGEIYVGGYNETVFRLSAHTVTITEAVFLPLLGR